MTFEFGKRFQGDGLNCSNNMKKLLDSVRKLLKAVGEKVVNSLSGTGIGSNETILRTFYTISRTIEIPITRSAGGVEVELIATPQALTQFSNEYEEPTIREFTSRLDEGMSVYDVGSGIGLFSILAREYVGETGDVTAIEPSPYRVSQILGNLHLNDMRDVQVYSGAAGDNNGYVNIDINRLTGSASHFEKDSDMGSQDVVSVNVPTIPLRDLPEADLVKIDIEGAEVAALRGMEEHLASGEVEVICEVHPDRIKDLGHSVNSLWELLREYNYQIYEIAGNGLIEAGIPDSRGHYLFTPSHQE